MNLHALKYESPMAFKFAEPKVCHSFHFYFLSFPVFLEVSLDATLSRDSNDRVITQVHRLSEATIRSARKRKFSIGLSRSVLVNVCYSKSVKSSKLCIEMDSADLLERPPLRFHLTKNPQLPDTVHFTSQCTHLLL